MHKLSRQLCVRTGRSSSCLNTWFSWQDPSTQQVHNAHQKQCNLCTRTNVNILAGGLTSTLLTYNDESRVDSLKQLWGKHWTLHSLCAWAEWNVCKRTISLSLLIHTSKEFVCAATTLDISLLSHSFKIGASTIKSVAFWTKLFFGCAKCSRRISGDCSLFRIIAGINLLQGAMLTQQTIQFCFSCILHPPEFVCTLKTDVLLALIGSKLCKHVVSSSALCRKEVTPPCRTWGSCWSQSHLAGN